LKDVLSALDDARHFGFSTRRSVLATNFPELQLFTPASPVSMHRSRHRKSSEKQVAMIAQKVIDAN
jgi:hypothetical protein